jgi:hypothetical protein
MEETAAATRFAIGPRAGLAAGLMVLAAGVLLVAGGGTALADLQADLAELDKIRAGRQTDFAAVEQKGQELLGKYTTPEEQGRIYYTLAVAYGQSGLLKPERGIALAEEALQRPISQNDRLTMFVTIGDSYSGGKWDGPASFPERRRRAVASYLSGLNELLKLDLPAEKPAREPGLPKGFVDQTPEGRARYEVAVEARRKSQEIYQLVNQREVLTRQVAYPYTVKPYATEELRAELERSLADEPLRQQIMAAVEAKVPPVLTIEMTNPPAAAEAQAFSTWLIVGGLLVSGVAIFIAWRRFAPK